MGVFAKPVIRIYRGTENTVKDKVRELKREGKKIKEISSYLNISSKDVYVYLKQD